MGKTSNEKSAGNSGRRTFLTGAIVGTALVRALRDGGVDGLAATTRELSRGAGPRPGTA